MRRSPAMKCRGRWSEVKLYKRVLVGHRHRLCRRWRFDTARHGHSPPTIERLKWALAFRSVKWFFQYLFSFFSLFNRRIKACNLIVEWILLLLPTNGFSSILPASVRLFSLAFHFVFVLICDQFYYFYWFAFIVSVLMAVLLFNCFDCVTRLSMLSIAVDWTALPKGQRLARTCVTKSL